MEAQALDYPGHKTTRVCSFRGAFAIDRILYRQFAGAIADEILWYLRQDQYYIDRVHIEEVGERVGIDDETTTGIFLCLAGEVWAGEHLSEEGPPMTVLAPRSEAPPWNRVTFDPDWFRQRGKLPTSDTS
ncbi:MAG: hypothetical protein JOZ19_14315 [Rubrobacter sp.]|nr:hypothetical protein [Rubrobacter sp.]